MTAIMTTPTTPTTSTKNPDNDNEGEDDEDYTPLSDIEKGEMYHEAKEIKTARNEAPIPTNRLWHLLNRINITTAPEFRIKRIPRPR
jgi:hypothetical protein